VILLRFNDDNSSLSETLFQLKVHTYAASPALIPYCTDKVLCPQFTAKSLNRQAKKAQKDENAEKARLKKVREPSFSFRLALPGTLHPKCERKASASAPAVVYMHAY
jgi:hypothetical protein